MRCAGLVLGAALPVLAGACAVGPRYKEPQTQPPPQWATSLEAGEISTPAELDGWWKSFKDPGLDGLIAVAIRANLPLQVAEARVREARAERDVVAGARGPTLANADSYTRNRYSANGFPPLPAAVPLDYNLFSAGFDAAWEIDIFGGTRRAVEAAAAEVGAAEYARRDLFVSILAEVARNYIDARAYQRQLAITRDNIAVEQDIVSLTRSRFQSGLSGELDVQEASALLAATQSQVPVLESGFERSVHHLAILVGQPPGSLLEQMSAVKPIPLTPPAVPVGLPSDLLRRRPDVQRTERELAASTARIGVATADLLPKFSLTGAIGLASIGASGFPDAASREWVAGPGVQWKLFESGRLRANIRVQNARQEQALISYQETVLTALEDVENALSGYGKEQSRRGSLQQSVDANQQALVLSRELYTGGLADFLKVLDAERALYGSQAALVDSERSVSVDLVQLYKALGGGWDERSGLSRQ